MQFPPNPAVDDTHIGPGERKYKFDGTAWFPNTSDIGSLEIEDRQVEEIIMPASGGSGSSSSSVYNYPAVNLTLENSGKHTIQVLPFQTTTSLESGTKIGGTFTIRNSAGTDVGSVNFQPRNFDATVTNLAYIGGSQTRLLDLSAGDYTLHFGSAAGSGSGNRTSSSGYVRVLVRNEESKTVLKAEDLPVDDRSASGYIDIGTARMQWGVTNGTPSATFSTPFRAGTTPSVVPIPLRAGDNLGITLQAVDHLGFSCWVVRNESDVGTNPTQLHWHAIGLKP